MMSPLSKHRAFTLVEIIATLGLTLFIMGALFQAILNQSRTNEVAGERLSESQVARSLLHRMAEELRQVQPPIERNPFPIRARTLLTYGDRDWSNRSTQEESNNTLGQMGEGVEPTDGEKLPEVDGPERWALLGTGDRLLFNTRATADGPSPIDRYLAEKGEVSPSDDSSQEAKRIAASRWSDLRQVYYLARPLPEALKEKEPTAEQEVPAVDGQRPTNPIFAGVIRQEVRLVFSNAAHEDSFHQLKDHLFAKEDDSFELPELPEPETVSLESEQAVPLPDRTQTEVLTEQISAIRFRYHNGSQWQANWSDPHRLPIAIEIHLSFDPRAADPEFLTEYLEEHPLGNAAEENTNSASPVADEEEPLFAYRLVVALPMADPIAPAGNDSSSREQLPESVGPVGGPAGRDGEEGR
jgi:type II secretory pathway pseudopilin PulG